MAFKITRGSTDVTTGEVLGKLYAMCSVAGTLTVKWKDDGASSVVTATSGMIIDISNTISVAVTTGTWSFSDVK